MMKQKTLIVIVGPTAIGKTALAIDIAQHFQTEIISADSRQFFKEMSIGTAKPSAEELARAQHHFINSHSIHDEVSVGSFEKEAILLLNQLYNKHAILIMAGGSGLYINAVLYGFDELPTIEDSIREKLNHRLVQDGLATLQEELKSVDPLYYAEVDIHNPQRVIRALEVFYSSGKPFSSFRKGALQSRDFKTILIGLNTEREELYQRINLRVDLMLKEGLINEVKSLQAYKHLNSLNTVGYSEIFKALDGETSIEQAVNLIKQNTRRFAKRQLTWFRKLEGINWFKPDEKEKIISFIKKEMI